MPAPLFLLVYFTFVTTALSHPQEVAMLLAVALIIKLSCRY